MLSTCASGSAVAAESLLLLNVSSILKDILAGSGPVASISVVPSSMNRPPEQVSIYEENLVDNIIDCFLKIELMFLISLSVFWKCSYELAKVPSMYGIIESLSLLRI